MSIVGNVRLRAHQGLACDDHDPLIVCSCGVRRELGVELRGGLSPDDSEAAIAELEDVRARLTSGAASLAW